MAVVTVVKTVGTSSRNFSTWQLWEDGAPADLTTVKRFLAGTFVGTFTQGESLTFSVSGATGKFLDSDGSTYITFGVSSGTPAAPDVATGGSSGAVCTLSGSATHTGAIWQGEVYNDGLYTEQLLMSGSTTNSTCYKHITAATGQSFQDNASVRSNALTFNQSNGVAITWAGDGQTTVRANENYGRITGLQVKNSSGFGHPIQITDNGRVKDCIAIITGSNNYQAVNAGDSTPTLINVLMITSSSNHDNSLCNIGFGGGLVLGCTCVRTTNTSPVSTAYSFNSGFTGIVASNASFGFTSVMTGGPTVNAASGYNATDQASGLLGSTGNVYSVTYNATTPFTQASNSGTDFRAIASTALAAAGSLDATNAPLDISAYTRANPPTIGHWEITASGGGGGGAVVMPSYLTLMGVGGG